MRTRCPACSTAFRVTSEQLRLKAGKVRCGHCQGVFNAFDSLISDIPAEPTPPAKPPPAPAVAKAHAAPSGSIPQPASSQAAPVRREPVAPGTANEPPPAPHAEPLRDTPPPPAPESIAESTLAAREAGLVAARELADTPAYSRWAAGTLADDTAGSFDREPAAQSSWPFLIAAAMLLALLSAQLLFHFRTAIVQRLPDAAALYAIAKVNVPLPQHADLVEIEASDLQSDNARGLLVLQATLRNRAAFAQAWPALELTLTDMHDKVISRRVLQANEYLPPGTDLVAFAARSEMAIHLWLEAKGLGAAGYRLYLFYP